LKWKNLELFQEKWFFGLIIPIVIVTIWEAATRLQMVTTMFLPAPSRVLIAGRDLFIQKGVMVHVWSSIFLILRGFFLGLVTGFAAGAACGMILTAARLFSPLLNSLRQVPTIAWLPLIAFTVGHEDPGKLTIIALTVFFPVFFNTLQGISQVSPDYIEVARIYGFSRWQLFRRVLLPAALPTIFTGIRYGAGMSWAIILVAEMLSGHRGLGYLLDRRQELLFVDESIALLIVIGMLGFAIDYTILVSEGRMMRWNCRMS
jgi:sulfonate transport system permease protein